MAKKTKAQMRTIIRELLSEGTTGHAIGLGFSNFRANENPDFAKAYGRDAQTVGHSHQLAEQPVRSAMPADDMALKDAYKELQEILHDADLAMNAWVDKHQAQLDAAGELDDPNSLTIRMDDLRLQLVDLKDEAYKRR
tara:strand:+ start:387 stop:800 length:414 start_codon:yes stop_codon:yes gene_type:complete